MNRNDRQTFTLLLVQVAVVLPKGWGGGRAGKGRRVEGFRFVLSSVRYSSVHLRGLGCLEMHFHCIHFGGFHYVAKVLHLFLARTFSRSLSAALCACKFSVTCPCRAHSKVILSY